MNETKVKHTPGDWKVKETYADKAGFSIQDQNGKSIASINPNIRRDGEEKAANAHLIAAAPNLLEALKILEKNGHTQATWNRALKAIAKAEGRAQ